MKNIYILLLLVSNLLSAQNFQSDFTTHLKSNDTLNQKKVLEAWEQATPKDPELYTSYYNYYYRKGKEEIVTLTTEAPNGEHFVLTDSLQNTAGFLGSQTAYNAIFLEKAFAKITEGIALYPNRLDMRFGKIYGLGTVEDWSPFTTEIIKAIEQSAKNNNAWTWTNNEPRPDGKAFFLSALQSYQVQLYNTERDDLLPNMRQIAQTILKYYPESIESLSNLSITYFLEGDFDRGLEPLLRAEKINPADSIVLSNIAHGYKQKGNKDKAIEYYKKTIQHGDASMKSFAESQITKLMQ